MQKQQSLQTLFDSSKKILLIAPSHWEGDHITALLALQSVFQSLQKEVLAIGPSDKPFAFSSLDTSSVLTDLPESQNFIISLDTTKNKTQKIKYRTTETSVEILVIPESGSFSESDVSIRKGISDLDLIVTLGADNLEDLGPVFDAHATIFTNTPIVNFSISANNEFFGTFNIVDANKSSLCEIIFEFLNTHEDFAKTITPDIATLLLTGIIDNTSRFLDPKTKKSSFYAASQLYSLEADQDSIIERLFKQKKLSTLKAWGEILKNLEIDPVHKLSWTSINQDEFQATQSTPEEVSSLNDELLRHVKNTDLSVFFIEQEGSIRIQIRSNNAHVHFENLNAFLGGNGKLHKNGLDFVISDKKTIEIEYDFLKLLLDYQNEQLGLDPNTPLQKMNVFQTVATDVEKTTASAPLSQNKVPKAPQVIPFELFDVHQTPEQKAGTPQTEDKIKNDLPETQLDTTSDSKKNIPAWLK
jgi:nanoRNase/pAp phosphatase (c-di-AMP/oligoRNAs hydrolase)